jgi:hypothetical protein
MAANETGKADASGTSQEGGTSKAGGVGTGATGKNKALPANAQRPPGDVRRRVARKQRKGPFVKYVGAVSHRMIRPAQWKSLGIDLKDDTATHVWSVNNDKMIESSEFSEEQLDYLLVDDLQKGTNTHAFLEVDYNDKGQLVQVQYEDDSA